MVGTHYNIGWRILVVPTPPPPNFFQALEESLPVCDPGKLVPSQIKEYWARDLNSLA